MLAYYNPCAFVQLPRLNRWDPVGVIRCSLEQQTQQHGGSREYLRCQDEKKENKTRQKKINAVSRFRHHLRNSKHRLEKKIRACDSEESQLPVPRQDACTYACSQVDNATRADFRMDSKSCFVFLFLRRLKLFKVKMN